MDQPTPRTGPDHLDLYIIVLGIVAGVMLGPVLHTVAPDLYDRMFIGSGEVERRIAAYNLDLQAKTQTLKASGVSQEAIDELTRKAGPDIAVLQAQASESRLSHYLWILSRTTAMTLSIVMVMVFETLVDPLKQALRNRLARARYLLIAGWLTLVIAHPMMLQAFPLWFFVLVVGAALIFAFFPTGKKPAATQT